MEHLSLDSLKEPSSSSSPSSRRHTVSYQNGTSRPKVPARTQAAIDKVSEIINKMGGQLHTHVQDNGGTKHTPALRRTDGV